MTLDLRRNIVLAACIIMEGSWLFAILAMLNQSVTGGQLSVWGLLPVYILSFAASKALQRLRWHKSILTIIGWLLWIPVMFLSVKMQVFGSIAIADAAWLVAIKEAIAQIFYVFKPELMVIISSAGLWWLGRRMSYLNTDFRLAVAEFQFGLFILLIAFFVSYQLELDQSASVFTAMTFFTAGLIGISIANAQEGNSWLSAWYQGHWSGLLLVSIALILILGFVISIIVTPDFLTIVISWLKWLWGVIERVLAWLASLMPAPEPQKPLPSMPAMPSGEGADEFRVWQIPEFILTGLRWGWSIMMAGVIIFTLWRIASQLFSWMRRRMNSTGAEVEHLDGAFKADFLGWLKRIMFKLLGIKIRLKAKKKQFVSPEVASVRQLYSQLLQWAASAGYPRQSAQTPFEYLYVLGDMLPENRGDLDFITQHYVNVRYGLSAPDENVLKELKQSWHRVKHYPLKKKQGG